MDVQTNKIKVSKTSNIRWPAHQRGKLVLHEFSGDIAISTKQGCGGKTHVLSFCYSWNSPLKWSFYKTTKGMKCLKYLCINQMSLIKRFSRENRWRFEQSFIPGRILPFAWYTSEWREAGKSFFFQLSGFRPHLCGFDVPASFTHPAF